MIGAAGDCIVNVKDIFTELLLVDVVRGPHSTGAALVKRENSEIVLTKSPMPSPQLIGTQQYKDFINTVGVKVLMGHNRYATVGGHTVENAHPFQFENLVGAHNGTLDNWAINRLEDHKFFGTDSEALYNSISKNGVKKTIEKMSGAWALTWYDLETSSINMLRNSKRPLYYAYSEDRMTLFWASEASMLEWILGRNHMKIYDKTIFLCDPDKHYRWTVPDKLGTKFDKPVVAEVKERPFHHVSDYSWKKESKWDEFSYGQNQGPLWDRVTPVYKAPTDKIDTKKFRPPYKDVKGFAITKVKFEELVASGCVYCDTANSVWGDFIYPLKDDVDGRKLYMCEECYNTDDIRELIQQTC